MISFSAILLAAAVQAAPDTVLVTPGELRLDVDASHTFEAAVRTGGGEAVRAETVRWLVTDATVLSVDADGVVTALRPGRARVVAMVGGVIGLADVTVPQLPPAELELELPVTAIAAGTSAPLRVRARTRLGDALPSTDVRFVSSSDAIATVDSGGRIYAHRPGRATIRALAGDASATVDVQVTANPAVSYELVAPFESARTGDVVRFRVRARDDAGRAVGDLRPAWSVDGRGAQIEAEAGAGVFVAEEPGTYRVTALIGEELVRSATIRVEPRAIAERYELLPVGRGPIAEHNSGDTWAFEGVDGRDYAYIGTFMHDWMKAWDVTDPTSPVLTDSLRVDARRINDVKIHPNGRIGIITREGASDRRNGIVLLDLADPAHPRILSEYTETVSGGVHNVWIDGERDLVYACHNGTSDLHIIDISDPLNPREVGRWGLDSPRKTLHDAIVQDGYAYLSYWDDGLVILDVGAGTHGGSPTEPAFVSRISYPEGHTHVAWRHGDYVFVGDEIFPADWDASEPIEARGYIHVIDLTDIDEPVEVAKYEVPEAGAHNVWVEDDVLYVGYYQAGLRAVDVSGELRGDLYRQGREIAAFRPVDEHSVVPNWPMTWGAQIFKGNIYTSDLFSGLWITKLDPPRVVF